MENPDVIGVAAEKRTSSPDDGGVDGTNLRRDGVTLFQELQDGLLVRDRDAEAANPEFRHGLQKIWNIFHEEGQIYGVDFARDESCVVHKRRKGMPDGMANHCVDPRLARESASAV